MRRWVEHTGEAELEIEAAGEAEVFAEALAGLAELLAPEEAAAGAAGAEPDAPASYAIALRDGDRAGLLVAWLEELLWIAERDGVVPTAVAELALDDAGDLHARVLARPVPPRPLVKGVTWHDLRFERRGEAWHARVVLDV